MFCSSQPFPKKPGTTVSVPGSFCQCFPKSNPRRPMSRSSGLKMRMIPGPRSTCWNRTKNSRKYLLYAPCAESMFPHEHFGTLEARWRCTRGDSELNKKKDNPGTLLQRFWSPLNTPTDLQDHTPVGPTQAQLQSSEVEKDALHGLGWTGPDAICG